MAITALLDHASDAAGAREDDRWTVSIATEGALPDGGATEIVLHNISAGGLLLESPVALEKGTRLAIDLPEAGPTEAEVMWRSESLHGCRFAEPLAQRVLSAAQLRSALAPVDPADPATVRARGSLGKRLAKLRQDRGMTLAQVAEQLEVSKPTVWAWEHDRSQPVAGRIGALAEVLGVPEAELITGRDISHAEQAIEEARSAVAEAYGCAPSQVRIMIDL